MVERGIADGEGIRITADRLPLVVDWRLELVQIPVTDVDRAKTFYTEKAGFNADHDHTVSDEIRFVQLTPPGSACSIALGTGLGDMRPGSVQSLRLVVTDVDEGEEPRHVDSIWPI